MQKRQNHYVSHYLKTQPNQKQKQNRQTNEQTTKTRSKPSMDYSTPERPALRNLRQEDCHAFTGIQSETLFQNTIQHKLT